ncbi:MAG TPA: dTDP-4-dehydrorhamnose reductase [Anaerolineae bacterium]|nr:dTDP-4-dehydrorhamnose reductase [Anaerolineae bacterium]HOR00339.1 dTDP-4-dehydrorhamnose reductase [Anaerolineae bacterium]HPL26937.1 dTDP-4-dehydrorhamnose reductase [Anaerolineae bacterium]
MRIAITGAKGQLGSILQARLAANDLLPLDLPELDVTDALQVRRAFDAFRPEAVIHAAALTNVDQCESQPELTYRVNALGTQNVALACRRCDAAMLYISTGYVFDGRKGAPYFEYDAPAPQGIYARSKLGGEWATQAFLQRFYVVRIDRLFAPGGRNFVETVLRLAHERGSLSMATDEVGSPTYAPDLAEAVARLLPTEVYGIYHLTNAGVCSRYEWAREILRLAGLAHVPVTPTQDYARPAPVPKQLELANLCGAQLGVALRPWQEALADYFGERGA